MEPIDVLVIEDDDIVARTIERTLRGHEFRIAVANSGVQGLQVARRQLPALVLLDVIMPGMDGYAVCREMRADPLLANVPILFLTAKAKDEDKITGFRAGADDYLTSRLILTSSCSAFAPCCAARAARPPRRPPRLKNNAPSWSAPTPSTRRPSNWPRRAAKFSSRRCSSTCSII